MRIDTTVARQVFPDGLIPGDTVPLRIGDTVWPAQVAQVTYAGEQLTVTLELADAGISRWGDPVPHHPHPAPIAYRQDSDTDPSTREAASSGDSSVFCS